MKKTPDSFSKFIGLSIAFHLVIFTFLTVRLLFFPSQSPDYQQAVRVDVVALPEKNTEQPKAVKKKAPKKVEKKKAAPKKPKPKKKKIKKLKPKAKKVNLNKKKLKEEQNSAIARLKALQKLKDKQKKQESEQQASDQFKGNELSKGNSLSGLKKLHHESYLDDIDGHIRSFWNLPEWLANGNFSAHVVLLISKTGDVTSKTLVVKSGNDLFDQHVLGTIDKASPLPAPPANLVDFYATKGVELRFPK